MATKKKLLQAAAGQAGGAGLDVEDVFSTYFYTGNDSTQTITNGIDLDGEGGLVWTKCRSNTYNNVLITDDNGTQNFLHSNTTDALQNFFDLHISSYNSDGYSFSNAADINANGEDFASWTFRKAPKFFDVVTFTSASSGNTTFSHDLGADPGFVVIKNTQTSDPWIIYHRSTGTTKLLAFTTAAASEQGAGTFTATSTSFTVASNLMYTSQSYVAYLFAHNNGDGEFGPDGDADIIKCGSYTGTGASGNQIDLGFEPQWLMVKNTSTANQNWEMFDNMRGVATGGTAAELFPNTSSAERAAFNIFNFNATGFETESTLDETNANGDTYIYIAIRRGTAVPTSATEVFAPAVQGVSGANPTYPTGIVTDFSLTTSLGVSDKKAMTRLLGATELVTSDTSQEGTYTNAVWDYMNGWGNETNQTNKYSWAWKRAPKYMDVVAYTGNGAAGRTVSHNLGVAPEMIWVKERSGASNWSVYHSDLGNDKVIFLNLSSSVFTSGIDNWATTTPTSSVFSLGASSATNNSNDTYIAYLFASLDGISKVGSFSHTYGGTTNVDCGFTSGARFVLWKRTDGTRHWEFFDTTRGIVAGNDAYLRLSDTGAETSGDYIDPYSAGFSIGSALGSGDFIFYAIA